MQQSSQNWPANRISRLYDRHAESQNYFYVRHLTDLIEELVTPATLNFQDWQFFDCQEQLLKRLYNRKEATARIRTLLKCSQHQQLVPGIFYHEVEELHVRWRQRKQKLLVKQLQRALHIEQQSTAVKKPQRQTPCSEVNVSNLLGEISQYNPASTNYYLKKGRTSRIRRNQNTPSLSCSSLESMQRQLDSILSRCSFVNDLSVMGNRSPASKLRPIVNASIEPAKPSFAKTSTMRGDFSRKQQEVIPLRDKIVLAFHPSFLKKEELLKNKLCPNGLSLKSKCNTTERSHDSQKGTYAAKPSTTSLQKRAESQGKLRIRLHRSSSREKAPSIELKRASTKDRLVSYQSEHLVEPRNYRATTRKEALPRNFLTLNIETSRPAKAGNKAEITFPLKLRGA